MNEKVPEWKQEWVEALTDRLREGPASRDELSEAIGVSGRKLDWLLNALTKYGFLILEEKDGELVYKVNPNHPSEKSLWKLAYRRLAAS